MTSRVRRAGGFAAVSTLALAAPALGPLVVALFLAIAVLAAGVVDEGPLFELFARPGDFQDGRLNGLAGFSLAAAALGLLTTGSALLGQAPEETMPVPVFVAAVLVVGYGNLGAQLARERSDDDFVVATGFSAVGFVAALLGEVAVGVAAAGGVPADAGPLLYAFTFHAVVAALVGALLRDMLFERDDPLVMVAVGIALWFLSALTPAVHPLDVGIALGVAVLLGYVSYATGTASVPGMLSGVLLCSLTIVLGGVGWFVVLVSFYGIGGLSTKYGYERKRERGVAEENEGARGTGNVLGNSAVALVAVVAYAASGDIPVPAELFVFAFAGSVAAAMSDTLSSEFGGLFDNPRLVTTLERVDPGTDGAITWQGEVAGLAGALLIGGVAVALVPVSPLGGVAVVVGGMVGTTVDSLLGATIEGDLVDNEAVNFLATFGGAVAAVALGLAL